MEPSDAVRPSRGGRLGVGTVIVIVLVVAALVIAIAVWRGATAPVEVVTDAPISAGADGAEEGRGEGAAGDARAATGVGTGSGGEPREAELFVHVYGAVEKPGLYALPPGARVVDAVSAAGGATAEAAQEGVNLARGVTDGEQIGVPTVDELESGEAGGPGGAGGQGGGAGEGGPPVNLNTADEAELETLPGIGPALAQRVVAWREENGGFANVDDLLAVSGIGDKVLAGLSDLVTT